jgi:alpha-glucosidase (family GH31 glycosyl hydrolase)
MEFAEDIRKHGFKDSQLEIDDDWTPAYGDWVFQSQKFPDPAKMVKDLKELGFRVTIWMHPFANENSEAIKEKQYWIQDPSTMEPCIVKWWNGKAALLDITSPSSKSWFKSKCQHLRQFGIESFKIDAGEACYLPYNRRMHKPLQNPNAYNKLFVDLCHEIDPILRAQEVRSAIASQQVPMFFRVNDKDSNWSTVNGLKTVIPHVLNQGLLGYPFVLPDMIGGNTYSMVGFSKTSNFPSRELFIRWMQVNALMPAMQFSVAPWRYDQEVIHIAQKMCALHEKYSDMIVKLAQEATETGAPICRPVWWIAPTDETALTISSEFLLGSNVLVAPILDEGSTERDVYLPEGTWKDEITGVVLQGGKWIREYPAELDQLPYFTKMG